jgi:hypothetical protein
MLEKDLLLELVVEKLDRLKLSVMRVREVYLELVDPRHEQLDELKDRKHELLKPKV